MTQEGAGGWEVPENPDGEGLKEEMIENCVTFRKFTGRFELFLDGDENVEIIDLASRRGFAISNIELIDGPFDVRIVLDGKQMVRQVADSKEHNYRISDEELDDE